MALQLMQYRKQLAKTNEENIFLLPWGGCVCRNCEELGDLVKYKNISEYREIGEPMWLVLSLVLFRENVNSSFIFHFLILTVFINFREKFSPSTLVVVAL